MKLKPLKPNKRDIFLLCGLLLLAGGVAVQFSPGWGAIVAGAIMLAFGVLGGDD